MFGHNGLIRITGPILTALAIVSLFASSMKCVEAYGGSNPINQQASATAATSIGKIAFASYRDGNFDIYLMDADGGGQTRLTENPAEDFSPAWSPDGKRLALVSTRDGNAEI